MAQFDLYSNPDPETRQVIPYLLDVQNGLLEHLATRVVVPLLLPSEVGRPLVHLNPVLEVRGCSVVMSTSEIVGVPRAVLGHRVGSLAHERTRIVRALDVLISGV